MQRATEKQAAIRVGHQAGGGYGRVRSLAIGVRTHGLGSYPVIQASRRLRHQRPVSRYCRHSWSPARGDACSRTATQSRPTPSGVECRSNVCWSRPPTGAADPLLSFGRRPWTTATQRKRTTRWDRRQSLSCRSTRAQRCRRTRWPTPTGRQPSLPCNRRSP